MFKTYSYFSCVLLCFVLGCTADKPPEKMVETTELKDYDTLAGLESGQVALPVILKVREDQSFAVYDIAKNQVLELDEDGVVKNKIGRSGRGPGEYLFVNNIFLTEQYLYIIDTALYFVHQFDRKGNLVSTFDFGKIAGKPTTPPPIVGGVVKANEIDNQPFVTLQGDIILSNVNVGNKGQYLFQLWDWEGDKRSELGEVPEGSSFVLDNAELRNEALEGEVPSFYKANSFPVQDRGAPNEFFIVYSSLSRIAKYTSTGEKLWQKDVQTRESEAIRKHFLETMDQMSKPNRVDLEIYSSGASDGAGNLYLVANTEPVVIHQFNSSGELVHKYEFTSKEVTPVLDIDFENKRILAATESGEIRSYPL
ncbi:6-bladed beta-propeller [Aliifodinibius sp. S!AR15-10]|uniref:6-bladed beta-propeller n=1 Tax=Aliifodinibius sp. S!AR15-10 TaxID=2950437 RepID=UPI002855A245|nr:6-bladed beta-propeller [Aliifodinibius sp. S!AR15-10]MDR8393820.1 6-bladed beta-propeller [Aliifodinibius sp. S!AR15-10]